MFSWDQLPKPIFGLAPMDGVTDSAFRSIVYRQAPPDVIFTEFTSAEGLARGAEALLLDLKYEPEERPMIAQIFGFEIESFRTVIPLLAKLGFDGIDINMGCPSKNVVHHGGGAALIQAAEHAKKIVQSCHEELKKWFDETGKKIPLSVKTRLGYEAVAVKEWIGRLLEWKELSNISLHGRTFRQSYSGEANWEAIAEAAELAKGSGINLLGNGDLQSLEGAIEKIKKSGVNGVLFGRATYGKPWFFKHKNLYRESLSSPSHSTPEKEAISPSQKIEILFQHAKLLSERKPSKSFVQIRKHVGWYLKDFEGASELRRKLCQVEDFDTFRKIIEPLRES